MFYCLSVRILFLIASMVLIVYSSMDITAQSLDAQHTAQV